MAKFLIAILLATVATALAFPPFDNDYIRVIRSPYYNPYAYNPYEYQAPYNNEYYPQQNGYGSAHATASASAQANSGSPRYPYSGF